MWGLAAMAIVNSAAATYKGINECQKAGVEYKYIAPPPMPEFKPAKEDCSLLLALAFIGLIG